MRVHGLVGPARALFAAALLVSLSGCPEETTGTRDAAIPDLAGTGDGGGGADMAMTTPSTGQVAFADIVGTIHVPTVDGGVPYPLPTHVAATIATFPSVDGSQHHSGTSLHDCNWNRYDLTNASLTDNPIPDENAGTVTITGYHTTTMRSLMANGMPAANEPDSTITCGWGGAMKPYYGCVFTPSMVPTDALAFPEFNAGVLGFTPVATQITETFVAQQGSSWTSINALTLSSLPDSPKVTSINGNTSLNSLTNLEGLFNGSNNITITYDCNGACPTNVGGLTALLIETHLGKKWDTDATNPNRRARFGTLQCVDADAPGTPARQFVLTKEMQADILGSDMAQTVRVVLVRLRAVPSASGDHTLYLTAGKGNFAFITQN